MLQARCKSSPETSNEKTKKDKPLVSFLIYFWSLKCVKKMTQEMVICKKQWEYSPKPALLEPRRFLFCVRRGTSHHWTTGFSHDRMLGRSTLSWPPGEGEEGLASMAQLGQKGPLWGPWKTSCPSWRMHGIQVLENISLVSCANTPLGAGDPTAVPHQWLPNFFWDP